MSNTVVQENVQWALIRAARVHSLAERVRSMLALGERKIAREIAETAFAAVAVAKEGIVDDRAHAVAAGAGPELNRIDDAAAVVELTRQAIVERLQVMCEGFTSCPATRAEFERCLSSAILMVLWNARNVSTDERLALGPVIRQVEQGESPFAREAWEALQKAPPMVEWELIVPLVVQPAVEDMLPGQHREEWAAAVCRLLVADGEAENTG